MRTARLTAISFLIAFSLGSVASPAKAEMQTFLENPAGWSVIGETDKYYASFAKGVSSAGGTPELAFIFNVPNRRFALFFARPSTSPSSGSLPITIQFRSPTPNKQLPPLKLIAFGTDKLTATLSDADVATWTHGFTAGFSMSLTFPNSAWNFDLAGTTPAISAMAGAIGGAGIDGLPPPWQMNGYGNKQVADPAPNNSSQDRALEVASQKRQLDIANAEASKAKADAQKAQAEADKARAEADRAQAQARIEADTRAAAAEETRATAMRLAEEQRRKAAIAKAEQDAKGIEP